MSEPTLPQREQVPLSEPENGGNDLARLLGVLSESRWLIAGITAAVLALGIAYSFLKTPVYEADTKLQVLQQRKAGGLFGLEALSSLMQGTSIPTDTEIQLLQTRAVLVPVIGKLHLNIKIGGGGLPLIGSLFSSHGKRFAKVLVFQVPRALKGQAFTLVSRGGGAYRLLDPDGNAVLQGRVGVPAAGRVDTSGGAGLVNIKVDVLDLPAGKHVAITDTPMGQVVAALLQRLDIAEIGRQTGIVRVSMRGTSPFALAAELNAIAKTNVRQNVRQNSAQAADQLRFLNAQLPDLGSRLEAAQQKLADFLSKHQMLALSQNTQYLVTQTSALERQISPLQAQFAEAKSALGPRNPRLAALQSQLQAFKGQRAKLLASVTKLPKDEQTLVRLQENVNVAKGLYEAMLNQGQQLRVAKAGTVGDIVIVDPAVVPSVPVAPKKGLDIAISLLLGLMLGVLAAFARRALRRGIEDPEVLEERLQLPVYAVLAHSHRQRRLDRSRGLVEPGVARLLAVDEQGDQILEGLRSLRMGIQLILPKTGPRIICIASLGPSEGKTFAASNLAYLFAQGNLRVLLVDADLRRGHLHRIFGWPRGQGLSEVLEEKIPLNEAVRSTQLEKLHVITTGTLPKDAANLLINSDVGGHLRSFAEAYDLVILDVPPVLAVGDALILARHATHNLLLIKHGLHSLRQVRLAMKRFERHGIEFTGCVLNDVSAGAQRYAYREYGYQYQYKYK